VVTLRREHFIRSRQHRILYNLIPPEKRTMTSSFSTYLLSMTSFYHQRPTTALNRYETHIYDMIYLTAIGLTPAGSSTHLHTKQYIEQHIQYIEQHIIDTKQYMEKHNSRIRKSADRAPSLRVIPWHLPYN
jgi:hypothetical protein